MAIRGRFVLHGRFAAGVDGQLYARVSISFRLNTNRNAGQMAGVICFVAGPSDCLLWASGSTWPGPSSIHRRSPGLRLPVSSITLTEVPGIRLPARNSPQSASLPVWQDETLRGEIARPRNPHLIRKSGLLSPPCRGGSGKGRKEERCLSGIVIHRTVASTLEAD